MTTIVADTSVIINGNLAQQIESGSIRNSDLIIPQAVFDELQSQASNHKQQGFVGLEQIEKLNKLSEDSGVKILLKGSHPDINDIKFASSGRIDALIIDIAKQNDAILRLAEAPWFVVRCSRGPMIQQVGKRQTRHRQTTQT